MHDERLSDQSDEWAAWRTPIRIRKEDLVTRGDKLARVDWPARAELWECVKVLVPAVFSELARNAVWLIRRAIWRRT